MTRPLCLGLFLGSMLSASTLGFVVPPASAPAASTTALHMSSTSTQPKASTTDKASEEPLLLRAAKGLVSG